MDKTLVKVQLQITNVGTDNVRSVYMNPICTLEHTKVNPASCEKSTDLRKEYIEGTPSQVLK